MTSIFGGVDTTTQTVTIGAFLPPQNFDLYDIQPEFFSDGKFHMRWTNIDSGPGFTHNYQVNITGGPGVHRVRQQDPDRRPVGWRR